MARIAIVKVRSEHDVEWRLPRTAASALGLLGMTHLRDRLLETSGQTFMPQLALPYLAALGQAYNEARKTAHRFVLLDDRPSRIDLRGFDMVWFTAVTPTTPAAYRLSDQARRAGLITVIGGIHASTLPEEAAQHADAVVLGEGESTVPQILEDFDRHGRLRPIYHGGHDASLAGLPVPRWEDARIPDYCPWVVPVQTSRGCRNACAFCSTTRYQGARRRHRPVQEVADEIRTLQDRGILTPGKVVFFTDNNIVSDSDHRRGVQDSSYARSLFEALVPLGILWTGQGETHVADDPSLVELMARSGCFKLLVGFETINPDNLGTVGKPCNTVERYAEQIRLLHQHDISLIGCFIFGMDHDGPEVFDHTCRFIEQQIDVPQVSLLTPFPGTALHRRLKREDRLLHQDWSRYDITHVVMRPMRMTPGQAEKGYRRLLDRLFSFPAMVTRALRYALRRTTYRHPDMCFQTRFSSVLAPNLIYRSLCNIRREGNTTRPRAWRDRSLLSQRSWAGAYSSSMAR